jgi:hypothetical protein
MKALHLGDFTIASACDIRKNLYNKPKTKQEKKLWIYRNAFYNTRIFGICIYRNFNTCRKTSQQIKKCRDFNEIT